MHRIHGLSDPLKGMLAVAIGFFAFACCDIFQKMLSVSYTPLALGTYAMMACMGFYLAFSAYRGYLPHFRTMKGLKVYTLRAASLSVQYLCFLVAIASLPIATVYTMSYTMPLIITVMGFFVLKEKPHAKTIAVLLLGFAGVIIALRPGDWQISVPMLCALVIGFFMALSNLLVRFFPKDDHWMVKSSVPIMIEIAIFVVLAIIVDGGLQMPLLADIPLFLGAGLLMAVGIALLPYAFSKAPVAVIAPFQYTTLVWGVLFGWLFFGNIIDLWTLSGALLIIGAGLWLFLSHQADKTASGPLPVAENSNK